MSSPLDRIEAIGPYHFLIRVPGDSPERRFTATNEVTAQGALDADWEVIDLQALVNVAKAAERLDNALVLTAPKSAQAWIRKLVPRKKLRKALAALDKDLSTHAQRCSYCGGTETST